MRRHWFLGLLVLIVLWVGYNALVNDSYDASLRPLYWLLENTGVMGPR